MLDKKRMKALNAAYREGHIKEGVLLYLLFGGEDTGNSERTEERQRKKPERSERSERSGAKRKD